MDNIKTKKWDKVRQAKYYKEWRKKNKEKLAAYHKTWSEENKEHLEQYMINNDEHIKQVQKQYRLTHEKEVKEMWKNWYEAHPERSPRRRFTESKNKAIKKRNISWTLTFDEYAELIKMPCFYCNNELGEPVKRSCGLDRLDSNKGYETNNVVSCCYLCNIIKGAHFTPEETKIAVQAVLAFRKLPSTQGS